MEFDLKNLFLDTNYCLNKFEYEGIEQDYYVSESGRVDPDLTGQHIWEAAPILCKFMINNKEMFSKDGGKSVLEIGSGTGICGLVCSQLAKSVTLTDHEDVVMDLIKKNIEHVVKTQDYPKSISYSKIDWEFALDEDITINTITDIGDGQIEETQGTFGGYDIIIGSDLCQFENVPAILCKFLDWLFTLHDNKLVFYKSYVERYIVTHDNLKSELSKYNFTYESIERELCENCPEQ